MQQAAQEPAGHKVAPATKDYGPKQPPTKTVTSYSGTTSYGPSYAHRDSLANKVCQTASPTPTLSNYKDNREYKVFKAFKAQQVYAAKLAHKVFRAYKAYKEIKASKA